MSALSFACCELNCGGFFNFRHFFFEHVDPKRDWWCGSSFGQLYYDAMDELYKIAISSKNKVLIICGNVCFY